MGIEAELGTEGDVVKGEVQERTSDRTDRVAWAP
jgi:hypothetical protein